MGTHFRGIKIPSIAEKHQKRLTGPLSTFVINSKQQT